MARGTLERYKFYASDDAIEDVVSRLRNASLFSPALFVILESAEQVKQKADVDLLASWMRSAGTSPNTLVLTSDDTSVDRRLESAVPAGHKRIFWEMFENRKPEWLAQLFRKSGLTATRDAIDAILNMVENDTQTLRNECSRFSYCFEKDHVITARDVENILSHDREESAFTLFDAMSNASKSAVARFESSLEILRKLRATKDASPVALIASLTYCFRQLLTWHAIHAPGRRAAPEELRQKGFSGKRRQEQYTRAARVWTAAEAASALALLSQTDISIRETGSALEETYLALLIYSLVMKATSPCATYAQA